MTNDEVEKPERLRPTPSTVRELYLKSGNECAFPGCNERLIDNAGNFIGEICHIEAASPGGERFNPNMTNEERRAFGNLILLCRNHHAVTDDVETYSVEELKRIKAEHESPFTDVVERIRASFVDYTEESNTTHAKTGNSSNAVLEWDLSQEELMATVTDINSFFDRFTDLPHSTREFISIIVERGDVDSSFTDNISALAHDITEACETTKDTVRKHIQILAHHKIGYLDEDGEYGAYIVIYGADWSMWPDLKTYAKEKGFRIRELIVEGRLDLLD